MMKTTLGDEATALVAYGATSSHHLSEMKPQQMAMTNGMFKPGWQATVGNGVQQHFFGVGENPLQAVTMALVFEACARQGWG